MLLGPSSALRDASGGTGAEPGASGAEARGRLTGAVNHVRDGDTVELGSVAVRIANLDCAERATVKGQADSARMRELAAGQEVACELEGRRSYDREVASCALASSGEDLGEVLIAEGACGRWGSE